MVLMMISCCFELPTRAGIYSTMFGPTVVRTKYGKIRGTLKKLSNPHLPRVEAYLGLQYASLVENNTRFSPPTSPVLHWASVRPATAFRPVCPQPLPDLRKMKGVMPEERVEHFKRLLPFLTTQHEDCLYLNIYVPYASELWWRVLVLVVVAQ